MSAELALSIPAYLSAILPATGLTFPFMHHDLDPNAKEQALKRSFYFLKGLRIQ